MLRQKSVIQVRFQRFDFEAADRAARRVNRPRCGQISTRPQPHHKNALPPISGTGLPDLTLRVVLIVIREGLVVICNGLSIVFGDFPRGSRAKILEVMAFDATVVEFSPTAGATPEQPLESRM